MKRKNVKKLMVVLATASLVAGLSSNVFAGVEGCIEFWKTTDLAPGVLMPASGAGLGLNNYNGSVCPGTGTIGPVGTNSPLAAPVLPAVVGLPMAPYDTAMRADTGIKVAYEMTGTLAIPLNDYNGAAANTNQLSIVYIPTSDVPPGSFLDFELSAASAEWSTGNANIWLLRDTNPTVGVGGSGVYTPVATSIGTTKGKKITFLTGGSIIPGGTRLVISLNSTTIDNPQFSLSNSSCTPPTDGLSVAVTRGVTGFLVNIPGTTTAPVVTGGVSSPYGRYMIVDNTKRQFAFFTEHLASPTAALNATPANIDVANGKLTFVADKQYPGLDNSSITNVNYKLVTENLGLPFATCGGGRFDLCIDLATDPGALGFTFQPKDSNGANKKISTAAAFLDMNLYDTVALGGDVATADTLGGLINPLVAAPVAPAGLVADTNGIFPNSTGPAIEYYDAQDIFAGPADADEELPAYVGAYVSIVNNNPLFSNVFYNATLATTNATFLSLVTTGAVAMQTNYYINTTANLTFTNPGYIQTCTDTVPTHNIGINGSVFRVPYMYYDASNTAKTIVRVSNNEPIGTDPATITADFFVEGTGFVCEAVNLGTVYAKSSTVVDAFATMVPAMQAKATGGNADCQALVAALPAQSGRFTGIFTVTAPKDSVHAVAVQKNVGGGNTGDRVVPVLFDTKVTSTWQQ